MLSQVILHMVYNFNLWTIIAFVLLLNFDFIIYLLKHQKTKIRDIIYSEAICYIVIKYYYPEAY